MQQFFISLKLTTEHKRCYFFSKLWRYLQSFSFLDFFVPKNWRLISNYVKILHSYFTRWYAIRAKNETEGIISTVFWISLVTVRILMVIWFFLYTVWYFLCWNPLICQLFFMAIYIRRASNSRCHIFKRKWEKVTLYNGSPRKYYISQLITRITWWNV